MKTKTKKKPKGVGNITVRRKGAPAKKGKTIKLVSKKPNGTAILLTSLAIGITGALGYFGWQYYKKTQAGTTSVDKLNDELTKIKLPPLDTVVEEPKVHTPPKGKTRATKTAAAGFPLKKGGKGEQVRQMQQALIDKYGKSILPKYGADGDFGTETLTALQSKGFPSVIDESAFNVITGGGGNSAEATSEIVNLAAKLYRAAGSKSISSVLALLKTIRDKDHYQQVSHSFMQYRLNGVRKTLVTGLLDTFPTETYKQQIRTEFLRMGLHYNGSKWSLSGFGGQTIVTKEPSKVWASATQSMDVPANMVLGTEITQKLDFTLFENNKKYFLIKTSAVKYFK